MHKLYLIQMELLLFLWTLNGYLRQNQSIFSIIFAFLFTQILEQCIIKPDVHCFLPLEVTRILWICKQIGKNGASKQMFILFHLRQIQFVDSIFSIRFAFLYTQIWNNRTLNQMFIVLLSRKYFFFRSTLLFVNLTNNVALFGALSAPFSIW